MDSAAAVEEYWEEAHDGKVPSMALVAGQDHECELLVARAKHEGDLIPGKLVPAHRVCYVSFDGKEHSKRVYEVII